jgi:hypothetical protein
LVEKCLFLPPVSIEFEGERLGGDPAALDRPSIRRSSIELNNSTRVSIEKILGQKLSSTPMIERLPLDLTAVSPVPELKGQLAAVFVSGEGLRKALEPAPALRHIGFSDAKLLELRMSGTSIELYCSRQFGGFSDNEERVARLVDAAMQDPSIPSSQKEELRVVLKALQQKRSGATTQPGLNAVHRIGDLLKEENEDDSTSPFQNYEFGVGHNGIRISGSLLTSPPHFSTAVGTRGFLYGVLHLADRLRPDVSVSREALRGIHWNVHSAVMLAVFRALGSAGEDTAGWQIGNILPEPPRLRDGVELAMILEDPLLLQNGGWRCERIINTTAGRKSVTEIREAHAAGEQITLTSVPTPRWLVQSTNRYQFDFLALCASALLQVEFGLTWFRDSNSRKWACIIRSTDPPPISDGLKLFPPLFFIPFEGSGLLKRFDGTLNADHPFSLWLVERAPALRRTQPGVLSQLRSTLSRNVRDSEEIVITVNALLDQLRNLDPRNPPPRGVYLTLKDIETKAVSRYNE